MTNSTRPGFTLIELVVYMGMSAIVLVVVSVFMVNLSSSAARERVAYDLSTSGQLILNRLTYTVRNATGPIPTPVGSSLSIPTSSGTVTYAWVGTELIETLPSGTTGPLNPATVDVTDFTLTPETIGVTVALEITPKITIEPLVAPKTFTTTLVPRKKLYE